MGHPDDAALPAEPHIIDNLINAAAPEKAQTWNELRASYKPSFHQIADRKGVTMRARKRRVEFDGKTMTWVWLLGFAGWRAFRLHGPHLLWRKMTGTAIDAELRAEDPTFAEAEDDYDAVLYVVRDFPELESVDWEGWPDGVPRPQADKSGLDVEQQASFDLTMIAVAYMLLHEVRHVMYNVMSDAGDERPPARDEEFECDAFARRFLLYGLTEYARQSSQSVEDVLAKRVAGIALGTYALYEFTPEGGRGGSADYPPAADRLDALFREVSLPGDHWFWNFAASLLIASVVKRDRGAEIPINTGSELCHALVQMIRDRNES